MTYDSLNTSTKLRYVSYFTLPSYEFFNNLLKSVLASDVDSIFIYKVVYL